MEKHSANYKLTNDRAHNFLLTGVGCTLPGMDWMMGSESIEADWLVVLAQDAVITDVSGLRLTGCTEDEHLTLSLLSNLCQATSSDREKLPSCNLLFYMNRLIVLILYTIVNKINSKATMSTQEE